MSRLPRWQPKNGFPAQVADHHRAERAGEVLAEIDQADAFEGAHQSASPLKAAISASL